ncbi:hypothetical protein VNO80_20868 [Phaseolus coccineus]|uniref:Uncharacterized protein n=1 Tax=Phaseolus coccineus TaxID=3886 RepID=A0AAN9M1C9_PHACN
MRRLSLKRNTPLLSSKERFRRTEDAASSILLLLSSFDIALGFADFRFLFDSVPSHPQLLTIPLLFRLQNSSNRNISAHKLRHDLVL